MRAVHGRFNSGNGVLFLSFSRRTPYTILSFIQRASRSYSPIPEKINIFRMKWVMAPSSLVHYYSYICARILGFKLTFLSYSFNVEVDVLTLAQTYEWTWRPAKPTTVVSGLWILALDPFPDLFPRFFRDAHKARVFTPFLNIWGSRKQGIWNCSEKRKGAKERKKPGLKGPEQLEKREKF